MAYKHLTKNEIETAFAKQEKQTRDFTRFLLEIANKRQRKHFYDVTNITIEGELLLSLGYWTLSEMFYDSKILYFNPPIGVIGMTINKR